VLYSEWVEVVLRKIADGEPRQPYGMESLGKALGLAMDNRPGGDYMAQFGAIAAAVDDLSDVGLLAENDPYRLAVTPQARRYRTHSLRDQWPALREGHLEPDEETYLAALATLSEVSHENWAEVHSLSSVDVFHGIGWEWDRQRSWTVLQGLTAGQFVKSNSTNTSDTVRLCLAGAIRVHDEAGAALAEAREHLTVGRLRAAGCIAGGRCASRRRPRSPRSYRGSRTTTTR
jgi:hypothetical protein